MQPLTKPYVYNLLDQIKEAEHIDISRYVAMLVGNDEIPYEAIVFINQHIPIERLTTYNAIYKKRNKSRLFRNIVSDKLSTEDKAVVLSSILNQCLISIKHDNNVDKQDLVASVNIELILNALHSYMFNNDESEILECFEMFRVIFKTLFPKK